MHKIILILITSLLLSGCVTQRVCNAKFPPQETVRVDSVVIKEVIVRDTTIFVHIAPDTVRDTVHVVIREGLAESRRSELRTELATSWAQVRGGVLLHELQQKDTTMARLIERAIREATTTITVDREVVRVVEVNRLKWWQEALAWVGAASLALLIILFAFRFMLL